MTAVSSSQPMLPLPTGSATPSQNRALAAPAEQGQQKTTVAAPAAASPAQQVHSGSIAPYSLRFDTDMQCFVLEARDPVSGLVIFQMPRETAYREMEALTGGGAAAHRGSSVDEST